MQSTLDWLERQELYVSAVKENDPAWKDRPKKTATLILEYIAQIRKRIAGRAATGEIDPLTKTLVQNIVDLQKEIDRFTTR
jgi:hypothetical protein